MQRLQEVTAVSSPSGNNIDCGAGKPTNKVKCLNEEKQSKWL